jgi:hypothetical protein
MLIQSAFGLLFQGQYRDVAWINASWFGNDWVTLVGAVPLLAVALTFARRGSVRGLLVWLGALGYGAYNYAYYLFGAALNAFFALYVIGVVLAATTLILSLSRLDVAAIAFRFRMQTPVRLIGGYLGFVGVGLAAVWLGMWAAYVFAGRPTPVEPEAFKLVAALDLSMMVTVLTFGGALLWQRHAWGYVLAAIAITQASLSLLVLSINSLVAIRRGLAQSPGELPVWSTLAALTIAAGVLLLTNVRGEPSRR